MGKYKTFADYCMQLVLKKVWNTTHYGIENFDSIGDPMFEEICE